MASLRQWQQDLAQSEPALGAVVAPPPPAPRSYLNLLDSPVFVGCSVAALVAIVLLAWRPPLVCEAAEADPEGRPSRLHAGSWVAWSVAAGAGAVALPFVWSAWE